MTGEIRNKVTLFQTDANAADRHFPRIEVVRDSFGREGYPDIMVPLDITVHPDDEVTFECSAWDPDDRPLKWKCAVLAAPADTVEGEGATCRMTWRVTEAHIAAQSFVRITLMSDRPYHRTAIGDDGHVDFQYAVLPR